MSQVAATPALLVGLTAAEVAERRARGEINRVRHTDAADYLAIAARNLFTLFNALVLPAAVALFLLGEYGDGLAVSGMALTNLLLGLVQEIRAKRHLDRLTLLTETRVRARRDGQVQEIPSGEVVRDDVLELAAGDSVVADGPVLEARFLEVDEALLTGESEPVPRHVGESLLSGSFCVAGDGCYRAERVGVESFAQRTAGEARSYRHHLSPIQKSVNRLLALLTAVAVLFCMAYVAADALHPMEKRDLWKMIAATITSMIPQGLVVMATFAFVLGAVRLSRRGALVHVLGAVESMASIDTLCLDKTGTLTTNRLHLEKLIPLDAERSEETIRDRLRLFASASLDRSSKSLAAIRSALGETPVEVLDQLPFKSQNRFSAVRVHHQDSEHVLVLGAGEALRPFLVGGRISNPSYETSLRLLLFAEAINLPQRPFAGSLEGFVLRPLALIGLADELRPEARGVLEELAGQGVRFKVLSGDHPGSVRAAIAPLTRGANLPAVKALAESPVLSGADLQSAADATERIDTGCVFGRLAPAQKVQVIATLKNQGRHVAMIGDGVNDVLAIKSAHVGIALGDGAAASKTVSGIVLETNDFALLPETLAEGRTILRNLRRAAKLFLVKNVFTLILIVGALGVLGLPFPYLPRQVTLLNFLTIGAPSLVLMLDHRRPGAASAAGFLRDTCGFALRTGLVLGIAGLLLLWLSNWVWHDDERLQRTQLLSLLVLLGLTTLLRVSLGDRRFLALAAASLLLYLAVLYCPPIGGFFALTPLTLVQWGRLLTLTCGACLLLVLSDTLPSRASNVSERRT
jgi:cation-transporting ATPase E